MNVAAGVIGDAVERAVITFVLEPLAARAAAPARQPLRQTLTVCGIRFSSIETAHVAREPMLLAGIKRRKCGNRTILVPVAPYVAIS